MNESDETIIPNDKTLAVKKKFKKILQQVIKTYERNKLIMLQNNEQVYVSCFKLNENKILTLTKKTTSGYHTT